MISLPMQTSRFIAFIRVGLLVVAFSAGVVSLRYSSATIYGNGYFPNPISDQIYVSSMSPNDVLLARSACSTPYNEVQYVVGLNTRQWPLPSPFFPAEHLDNGTYSILYGCSGNIYTAHPATMCLCASNGSCYQMNETGPSTELYFYAWCDDDGECVTYLGLCDFGTSGVFWDVATGEEVTNCTAINAGGPLEDCFLDSTNCSYLPVAYVNCGPCPSATLELDCPGPIERVGKYTPSLYDASPLVLPQPAPGENFHCITGINAIGTCDNCSSPNTIQYFYATDMMGQFACLNGSDPTQVDWTGLCMCDVLGGCYRFRTLPNGSVATINSVMDVAAGTEPVGFVVILECRTIDPSAVLEDVHGGAVFACDGEYSDFVLPVASLRCSGGCPTDQPLEIICSGPYDSV